jgi:hypothetical protein
VSGKINLLSCVQFVAFGGVSRTLASPITDISLGSIGTAPGASITGPYHLQSGLAHLNTGPALTCLEDSKGAYNDASVATCQFTLVGGSTSLTSKEESYSTTTGAVTMSGGLDQFMKIMRV